MEKPLSGKGGDHFTTQTSFTHNIQYWVSRNDTRTYNSVWEYDAAAPLEVSALFDQQKDDAAPWIFARELPINGLVEPTGEGDIRFKPDSKKAIIMTFVDQNDERQCDIWLPRLHLAKFILRTYAVVPQKKETELLDPIIDDAIRHIWAKRED
jgi:hypothetical protein